MCKPSGIKLTVGSIIISAFGALSMQSLPAQSTKFAYPKENQSQEQQTKDKAECHQWSVQQSGFDPTAVSPPTQ